MCHVVVGVVRDPEMSEKKNEASPLAGEPAVLVSTWPRQFHFRVTLRMRENADSRGEVSAGRRSGRGGFGRKSRCRQGPATALTHTHTPCDVPRWVWSLVAVEAPRVARGSVHDGVGGGE